MAWEIEFRSRRRFQGFIMESLKENYQVPQWFVNARFGLLKWLPGCGGRIIEGDGRDILQLHRALLASLLPV